MTLLHLRPRQAFTSQMQEQRRVDHLQNGTKQGRFYSMLKSAWDLARLFGKRTTIHGVNRLLGETAGRYERFVWLLTVILAFMGSVYVCLLLSRRFKEGKLQTVVDSTRLPVYKIFFPVVTVCNLNTLNYDRIEEAKLRFLPNETSAEERQLFERIVALYDQMGFARFDRFSVLKNESLESLNNVNFTQVVEFMTWRCEEFLDKCQWRRTSMNCCEIFFKRRTSRGPCWAFNTLETEEGRNMQRLDPMWPWRTGGAGPKSALQLRAFIHPESHFPHRRNKRGLSVMISEPHVWHIDHFTVYENTDTLIAIEPLKYYHDNDTRSIASQQRQCVFKDERSSADFKSLHNFVYMYENCQSECHQEYLMRYCNCTLDLLFPPGQYPACKVQDLLCLAQNNDRFLFTLQPDEKDFLQNAEEGMFCKCFRNCYSYHYLPDARSSFLPAEMHKNASYVDLDVHFRYDTLMVYRTSLVFGWVDLMVAFGGIAGLFLGCSLISAMELIYFAFVEMPIFVLKRIRRKKKPLLCHNESFRSNSSKFGGFMQRNNLSSVNQFEEFVLKKAMDKTVS